MVELVLNWLVLGGLLFLLACLAMSLLGWHDGGSANKDDW